MTDDFRCTWCGDEHPNREVGFNWPDAVFALDAPAGVREQLADLSNEDTLELDRCCFVRGWAPVSVDGAADAYGVGFWVQVARPDYDRFLEAAGGRHAPLYGRIANQLLLGAPTLGAPARAEFRGDGLRPLIRLVGDHPFAAMQAHGVDGETVGEWMSEAQHDREGAPLGEPFVAEIARHGWELFDAFACGLVPVQARPRVGQNVKLRFRFLAANHVGDPTELTAGWWVSIDAMPSEARWSGTLANVPRVPSTLSLGSRIWLSPEHVLEHEQSS